MDIADVEGRYLERARSAIGARIAGIELILPDRLPAPAGSGAVLAGWWVDAAAADGRIVLPNPYDSVDVIAAMEAWVWSVAQMLVVPLGESLDAIASRPRRPAAYWRILLTPWLVHLTSALADRRLFCRAVSALVPDRLVLVPAVPDPPATTADGLRRLRTDAGNAGLLAVLAPFLGLRTVVRESWPSEPDSTVTPSSSPRAWELVREVPRAATAAALARLPARRVGLVGLTRLSATELLRLEAGIRGLAPLPRQTLRSSTLLMPLADRAARSRLAQPDASDPLERLTREAIPDVLPRSLLEGFTAIEAEARRRYGRPLNALVGNYSVDEVQNEFLARSRAAGRRLAFAQHGGFYLQSQVNAQERLEIEPESTFLSWGGRGSNVVPTPNPYLERLRDSHRGGTRITIVEALEPPDAYVVRFAGHPLANQGYETARMLAEMVRLLSAARRSHLALKRFPNPIGRPSRPEALEALPFDGPAGGAAAWMATSRLAVIPYLDTALIEAMVIGTPTIGLWNPAHWPLRAELEPLFDRLKAAGIVHADPASAARQIDAVYDDVESWWTRSDVARVRAEFVERFAVSGDWLPAWSARLRDLSN